MRLREARDRRDESRRLLACGIDPSEHRKVTKTARADRATNSLEVVAREWYAKSSLTWATNHGELRKAEWADMDFDAAEWRYTVTKTDTVQIVLPSSQAVAILRELHALTGEGGFVVPGGRSNGRPIGDNAILAALRRTGVGKDEMSGHGFRAMARTILDGGLGIRPDFIEHQLAHAVRDPNRRAYDRTPHLNERRQMMQAWVDYLDRLKAGAEVIPLHSPAA